MKHKLTFIQVIVCFLFLNLQVIAQPVVTPTTAPYYGTAAYPYWGKYVNTPMSQVTPAKWINTDSVKIGWDWSLPSFVKPPKKSTFSLFRNTTMRQNDLLTLVKPSFPCNATVVHWLGWKDLEPTEGIFTFEQLLSNIQVCTDRGYKSIVRIHSSATRWAPPWVANLGIETFYQSADITNYDIADPRFHSRYVKLVEAIGNSGIPHRPDVVGLYVGYASKANGDEGIGPYKDPLQTDTVKHVRERLDAWGRITVGVENKVYMGGISYYGINKGFGIRRGFVENYLYTLPEEKIGQLIDANGYIYVDETNQIIKRNLFHGEENEEYATKYATAPDYQYGQTTEPFPYRYFSSNLRMLQMRCNESMNYSHALLPEMLAWVGQNLGRTIDEAPDVWSALRESYINSGQRQPVKNFERWLFQRDATGYTTTPAIKIDHGFRLWMCADDRRFDYIAREGKKIGFNFDKNWTGVKDSLAFKISLLDHNAGTLNLKYSNGSEMVTLSKPLLGDSLLKTYTFFVKDYTNGANISGKFDFTLEAGDNTKSIIVSFVRVVQAGTINQTNSVQPKTEEASIKIKYISELNAIKITGINRIKNVSVYNVQGQKVVFLAPLTNDCIVSTSEIPKGVYLVVANGSNGIIESKKISLNNN